MIPKRGKGKFKLDCGRTMMYKHYKTRCKEHNMDYRYNLSYTEWSNILNVFNKRVSKVIMEEAFEFLMPHNLGIIRIKKYKQKKKLDESGELDKKGLTVNWGATRKMWKDDPETYKNKKIVWHTNEHSDGYVFKWHFSNYRSRCPNKMYYEFKPCRDNKRKIAELQFSDDFNGDYYS